MLCCKWPSKVEVVIVLIVVFTLHLCMCVCSSASLVRPVGHPGFTALKTFSDSSCGSSLCAASCHRESTLTHGESIMKYYMTVFKYGSRGSCGLEGSPTPTSVPRGSNKKIKFMEVSVLICSQQHCRQFIVIKSESDITSEPMTASAEAPDSVPHLPAVTDSSLIQLTYMRNEEEERKVFLRCSKPRWAAFPLLFS